MPGTSPGMTRRETLDEPGRTAYLLARAVARPLFVHAPSATGDGCAAAGPFPKMVRRARLVAARASAGAAWEGARQPLGAADCAYRRWQDAGGISADAGGVLRKPRAERGRSARAARRVGVSRGHGA